MNRSKENILRAIKSLFNFARKQRYIPREIADEIAEVAAPKGEVSKIGIYTPVDGAWIRKEAQKPIGHNYPPVIITAEMARERPDLKPVIGQKLPAIAWLWTLTVKSPNPAFSHVDAPLASTFILSKPFPLQLKQFEIGWPASFTLLEQNRLCIGSLHRKKTSPPTHGQGQKWQRRPAAESGRTELGRRWDGSATFFTPEQLSWLYLIRDHIATRLSIDQEDYEAVPFNQIGGPGKTHQLFGDALPALLEELNTKLAA